MSDQNPHGQQGWDQQGQQPQGQQPGWGQQPQQGQQPGWGQQPQGQQQGWGQQPQQGQQGWGQQGQGQPPGQPPQQWGQPGPYGGGPGYVDTSPGSLHHVEANYGKVADFGQRAIAYIIDYAISLIGLIPMIIGVIVMVASIPTPGTYNYDTGTYDSEGGSTGGLVTGIILMVIGTLVALGIQIWNRWIRQGKTGQSIGKKQVGLKTIGSTTGQPIGALNCFLRDMVNGLANSVIYLGWLWMLWDPNRQTLGDKVMNSTVITVPKD